MTIISHDKRFVFVHIPKTGGTSVSDALRPFLSEQEWINTQPPRLYKHLTKSEIVKKLPSREQNDYTFFTVVRHPMTLLFSLYNYCRFVYTKNPLSPLCQKIDFTCFVRAVCGKDDDLERIRYHIVNNLLRYGQHVYMDERTTVLRFENLNDDFQRLCIDILKIGPVGLPHGNASTQVDDPLLVPCDDETRRMVYEKFRTDFELFGYR